MDSCPSGDLRGDVDLCASRRQEPSGSRSSFSPHRDSVPLDSTRADLLRVQGAAWNLKVARAFGATLVSHLLVLAVIVPSSYWHAKVVPIVQRS